MVFIIHGAKGTGKTKTIIERANETNIDGDAVFITDTDKYMYNLKRELRFINACSYGISSELGLLGFIRGLVAGNTDIQHIFIDGAHRLCCKNICDMQEFYGRLGDIASVCNIDITVTVSLDEKDLPDFIKKYIQ